MKLNTGLRHAALVSLVALGAASVSSSIGAAQPAVAPASAASDSAIQAAVEKLFDDDPLLDSRSLSVAVERGVATLQGDARSARDRDRAQRLTSRIRGVRAIINSIRVAPTERADADIADDVRAELAAEPATRELDLAIGANGGEVRLAGRVGSLVERRAAYVVASGVRGVLGVNIDDLVVVPADAQTVRELERAIAARLAWNVWTTDSELTVTVANGVARLRGRVPSLWVRDLAGDLASIPSVRLVDVTGVELLPGGTTVMERAQPGAYTDSEIAEAIDRALFFDFEVYSADIHIRVESGAVTLTGSVPTLAQREQAGRIARDAVGVSTVRNEIALRAEDAPGDQRLVELIKARLARAPAFADKPPIGVLVQAGVVTLLGTVETLHDKRRAAELVKRQVGVTAVLNQLRIS